MKYTSKTSKLESAILYTPKLALLNCRGKQPQTPVHCMKTIDGKMAKW